MWTNYLKIAVRRLSRHKKYTLLNMGGLTVGLAAVSVISIYIRGQLSYDDFHGPADEIFRVTYEVIDGDQHNHYAVAVPALGPALSEEFPGIKHSVRVSRPEIHLSSGAEWYKEDRFLFVDSTFFEVFGFELRRGSTASVLSRPNTVVLTQEMAAKYFGNQNPIGRSIQLDFRGEHTLEVTGIVQDPPPNSHLQFDFLSSYTTFTSIIPYFNADNWLLRGSYTYIQLQPDADASNLEAQFPAFMARSLAQVDVPRHHEFRLHLQPIADIHLNSQLRGELAPNGNATYVSILGVVAVLILLISGLNYVNLSTAQTVDRAKEVGVRTSVGADRRTLIVQFLGESIVLAAICGLLAIGLTRITMPLIESVAGTSPFLRLPGRADFWSLYAGAVVAMGLLSGAYPALYLSSLRPVHVLKTDTFPDMSGVSLRRALVVIEFGLAIVLLTGTTVAYQQMEFVRDLDLGFDKNELLVLPYENALQQPYQPETVKREFAQVDGVQRVSIASHVPTMGTPMNYQIRPVDGRQNAPVPITAYRIDEDFLPVLGIDLTAGRNFSSEIASDSSNFLINRAAAQLFGWESPLGRKLERPNPNGPSEAGRVVGLIEDLHFRSLHHTIEPLVLEMSPNTSQFVVLRLEGKDMAPVLTALEQQWNKLAPDRPFSYTILSDHYEALYGEEDRLADMVTLFSGLAVLIACLGLYGLTVYSTRRRTKEIGVRKVLGATVPDVLILLLTDFLKLAGISFILAAPLAYFAAERWLHEFAYRTDLGPTVFLTAGLAAVVITCLTVGYESVKAALTNPTESLRVE